MSMFSQAWKEVRTARTLTERIYRISPILLGLLKDIQAISGCSQRHLAKSNRKMAQRIQQKNDKAIAALGLERERIILRSGPFAGMEYGRASAGSVLGAKILGIYELEIANWIEEAVREEKYDTFIDVGCAEGYYATGFAYRCCNAHVFAYDIDERAQELARSLARANGVSDRIIVGGVCTKEELQSRLAVTRHALVFVDIEGYEEELLDPQAVPALRSADIIVELHEHERPGLTYRMLERFSETHIVEVVAAKPDKWKIRASQGLGQDVLDALWEGRRIPQLWLRMEAVAK